MRFILGTAGTGWISRNSIMFSETLELSVQKCFVTAGFRDGAFKVIWYDSSGNSTIVIECILAGGDKSSLRWLSTAST